MAYMDPMGNDLNLWFLATTEVLLKIKILNFPKHRSYLAHQQINPKLTQVVSTFGPSPRCN